MEQKNAQFSVFPELHRTHNEDTQTFKMSKFYIRLHLERHNHPQKAITAPVTSYITTPRKYSRHVSDLCSTGGSRRMGEEAMRINMRYIFTDSVLDDYHGVQLEILVQPTVH